VGPTGSLISLSHVNLYFFVKNEGNWGRGVGKSGQVKLGGEIMVRARR